MHCQTTRSCTAQWAKRESRWVEELCRQAKSALHTHTHTHTDLLAGHCCVSRYFCSHKAEITAELEEEIGSLKRELDGLQQQKLAIEQKGKSCESEMRELIKQNPAQFRQRA